MPQNMNNNFQHKNNNYVTNTHNTHFSNDQYRYVQMQIYKAQER